MCTCAVWLPRRVYSASLDTPAEWRAVRIPRSAFRGYRTGARLDTRSLQRIALLAIGRAISAAPRLALYPDPSAGD